LISANNIENKFSNNYIIYKEALRFKKDIFNARIKYFKKQE